MPMTEKQTKKYIENGGVFCPHCGSYDLKAGQPEVDVQIEVEVECLACGEEWIDLYSLTDVRESE